MRKPLQNEVKAGQGTQRRRISSALMEGNHCACSDSVLLA